MSSHNQTRRGRWMSLSMLAAVGAVGAITVHADSELPKPTKPRFIYIGTKSYSCAGLTNQIKEYTHEQTGLEFALIPTGVFPKPAKEEGKPVDISSFLMCKTEVTQNVWTKVMGDNPSVNKRNGNLPAESVTWLKAKEFCKKTGLTLPTELEWEYACRGGTRSAFFWGDKPNTKYCWLEDNAVERTRQVATRPPNAFGLYDMIGNVYEWCESWYHKSGMSYNHKGDRRGDAKSRVLRGGSAASASCCALSSARSGNWPDKATPYDGFRPVAYLETVELVE